MRTRTSVRRWRARHLPAPLPPLLAALPVALSATLLPATPLSPTAAGVRPARAEVARGDVGHRVVAEAARHRGAPYRWGASGPHAFDCSGFTRYVLGRFGRSLPHSSKGQYAVVRHVPRADRRIGDLIFSYRGRQIHHVGIYAGGDTIWHAPRSGDVVRRSRLWDSRYLVGRPT